MTTSASQHRNYRGGCVSRKFRGAHAASRVDFGAVAETDFWLRIPTYEARESTRKNRERFGVSRVIRRWRIQIQRLSADK